jgi:hypothetical protein
VAGSRRRLDSPSESRDSLTRHRLAAISRLRAVASRLARSAEAHCQKFWGGGGLSERRTRGAFREENTRAFTEREGKGREREGESGSSDRGEGKGRERAGAQRRGNGDLEPPLLLAGDAPLLQIDGDRTTTSTGSSSASHASADSAASQLRRGALQSPLTIPAAASSKLPHAPPPPPPRSLQAISSPVSNI